jgi:hypothetical protein
MFSIKAPVAALSIAASVLLGIPAFADSFMTVDSNGVVYDISGHKVKTLVIAPGITVATPAVVPTASANCDRVLQTQTIVPQSMLIPLPVDSSRMIINQPITTTVPTPIIPPLMEAVQSTVTRKTVTNTVVPSGSMTITSNSLPNVLMSVIDNRRSELERQIGLLEPAQSLMLQDQLGQIADEESAARVRGELSYEQALSLASDLDALSNRFFLTNQSVQLSPLVIMDNAGGRQIAVTDMMF